MLWNHSEWVSYHLYYNFKIKRKILSNEHEHIQHSVGSVVGIQHVVICLQLYRWSIEDHHKCWYKGFEHLCWYICVAIIDLYIAGGAWLEYGQLDFFDLYPDLKMYRLFCGWHRVAANDAAAQLRARRHSVNILYTKQWLRHWFANCKCIISSYTSRICGLFVSYGAVIISHFESHRLYFLGAL